MNPITSEHNKLGFIGIGYMGRPIARRLIDAGFPLIAYNRDRTKAEELVRHGVIVAESIAELAAVATSYCPACQVMKRS
ncbi:MAG TPA: NAD(P)-binding domain-containing protein [Candidatus Acidoferrum sp.]|nr:NAD(P)-binding domain-containing protein [Candidatus Acidoferrum sp.]